MRAKKKKKGGDTYQMHFHGWFHAIVSVFTIDMERDFF